MSSPMVSKLFSFKAHFRKKQKSFGALRTFEKKFIWFCNFFISLRKIKTIVLKFPGNLVYLRLYDKIATKLSVRCMCLIVLGNGFNVRTYFRETNLIFSSIQHSCSRFLDFILWSVENPNSHRYDVENCIKMVKAFLANEGYSSLTASQNLSLGTSTWNRHRNSK